MSSVFGWLVISSFAPAIAQTNSSNTFPKTITVTGSAEMEVVPDEIYVEVSLKEYQKKGQDKKDIETIKTEFLQACKTAGIADSMISISSFSGANDYFYYLKKAKKIPDMISGFSYQVKFNSSILIDALVEKLDDEATRMFAIVSTNHSKMTEFRKQLKILAVKAAKEKANYLAEAIDEKLGSAVSIKEPDETRVSSASTGSNQPVSYTTELINYNEKKGRSMVEFKKIKIRFEVNAIFALQ